MWRTGKITDVNVIVAICVWLEAPVDEFIRCRRQPLEGRKVQRGYVDGVDWKLFHACVSFLCGGRAHELAERSGCSYDLCLRVLAGDPCGESRFEQFCRAMKLPPRTFRLAL